MLQAQIQHFKIMAWFSNPEEATHSHFQPKISFSKVFSPKKTLVFLDLAAHLRSILSASKTKDKTKKTVTSSNLMPL